MSTALKKSIRYALKYNKLGSAPEPSHKRTHKDIKASQPIKKNDDTDIFAKVPHLLKYKQKVIIIGQIIADIATNNDIPGGKRFYCIYIQNGCKFRAVKARPLHVKGTCYFTELPVRKLRFTSLAIFATNDKVQHIPCHQVWVLPMLHICNIWRAAYIKDETKRDEQVNNAYEFFLTFKQQLLDVYCNLETSNKKNKKNIEEEEYYIQES